MKKLLSFTIALFAGLSTWAQAPDLLNYQGVARDSSGAPLAGITIGLNLIIHDSSASGAVVYQETQSPVTNQFGLYNVAIGSGAGTYHLSDVNWGSGPKYMEVQMDPTGGTSYVSLGATELLSVPYALYGASANSITDTTLAGNGTTASPLKIAQQGATTGQLLKWNGTAWAPANSNAWTMTGNAGTNSAIDFIGTRDTATLRFRVNNTWAGEINANNGNVSYGAGAGRANTTGYNNAVVGAAALYSNNAGYNNTAFGDSSLFSNTGGFSNTATGINAMKRNTTGVWNVAVGEAALEYGTNDSENTAVGAEALKNNTTGNENTAIGVIALNSNNTGMENTALGEATLYYNTTGNANTAVGGYALETNTTGTFNTALGYAAGVGFDTLTNATALGAYATVNASNKVVVGSTTVNTIGGYTSWTNLSDGRFKTDIKENVPGLDFINKLKPVTYRFQARKFEQFQGKTDTDIQKRKASFDATEAQVRTGFIAQYVEKAARASGYDFSGVHKPANDKDNYTLAYSEFTVPLVKAVQELSAQNAALQKQVAELTKRISDLEQKK